MNRIIILVIFLSFTTSLQAQSVESDELFSKGVELYNLKRYNEAISYFNKSNNIDKAQLDTTNSRRYYSEMWLSSCYMQLGKIKEAQAISPDYYMVPPIDRRLTVESDRFSELSNMFAQAGNLERALEYALRCADIEKQVAGKEHIWYGNSTIIIGNLYYALGDSINAEENYLINKNICKHTYGEYSERYVDALLSLASVNTDFSMKDGLDKATRYLDEAYSITHKRYPLLEAQIVNQQSVIAFRNKNYEQAKTLMMQALSLCELAEGKTSNNYEILLSNTIDLYQMFGQYDEAITLGQDFLEACNQANRSDSIPAFIMVKISQANIAKGDINNALIQIEKAENIMRQYGTAKVDYINILGIMSTIYSNAGNKQKAISLNSKVLEFYEKKGWLQEISYIAALNNQAQLFTDIGDYAGAVQLYEKSLELTKTIWGDKHLQYLCTIILWIEPYILLNIGNTNKQAIFQNRVKKVFIDIQARSLSPTDIAQEVDPDKFYMAIEKFLHLYLMDAPPQQEIQSLKEFISNLIKNDLTPNLGEEHPITIQYENDLAHILFLQGNYKEAILIKEKLLESSKKIYGTVSSSNLADIGTYYLYNNDISNSCIYFERCLQQTQQQIFSDFRWLTANERALYWARYKNMIENIIPMSYKAQGYARFLPLSYNALLLSKGMLLNSEIELHKLLQSKGNKNIREKLDKWRSLNMQIDRLSSQTSRPQPEIIEKLTAEANAIERDLLSSSKEFGDYTRALAITYEDVQNSLGQNDIAIEFAAFYTQPDSLLYCAYVLDKLHQPRMVILGTQKEYEATLKEAYSTPAFYNLVWKPIEEYMPENGNIYFSAFGIFHKVGIEYLPKAEQRNMIRLSSTRELALAHKNNIKKKAVLYGGLEYNMGAKDRDRIRLAYYNSESTPDLVFRDAPNIQDLRQKRSNLSYLNGAETEVLSISQLLRGKKITTLLQMGMDGTEESFKALSGKQISLLHIATHGFYEEPQPFISTSPYDNDYRTKHTEENSLSRSGLYLTGAADYLTDNNQYSPTDMEDGILTAKELSRLDFRGLDLVVLSACQTGLGDITSEGVFGLQRGFKKAGAQTLLMSLWKVDDTATLLLMTEFYNKLINGNSKKQSLYKAQQYLRTYQNGVYDKPEYWAAFIMLDGIN